MSIPLAIPNLAGNEERYLRECVSTNFVSSVGPFVDRFEERVLTLPCSTGLSGEDQATVIAAVRSCLAS